MSAQGPLVLGFLVWGFGVWGLGLTILICSARVCENCGLTFEYLEQVAGVDVTWVFSDQLTKDYPTVSLE